VVPEGSAEAADSDAAVVADAAFAPAPRNAVEGWKAAVPKAPPCAVVSAEAVTKVALVVAVKFAAVVADTALALAPRKADEG
jgi:hypothetical protein